MTRYAAFAGAYYIFQYVLAKYDCAWETADPAEDEYPDVPVKLKNNRFTRAMPARQTGFFWTGFSPAGRSLSHSWNPPSEGNPPE